MKKFLLCCLLIPAAAFASFEDIETGARATALGGAFVAHNGDTGSIFYNPAGIAGLKRSELMTSHESLFTGLSDGSSLGRNVAAFGMPLTRKGRFLGSAVVGLDMLSLDSLYNERKLTLGFGYPMKNGVMVGAALSNFSLSYGSDAYTEGSPVFAGGSSKSAFGLDAGIIKQAGSLNLGLSILNINEPDLGLKYDNKVARRMSAGLSYRNGPSVWDAALSLVGQDVRIKAGLERMFTLNNLKDDLFVRGGMNLGTRDYRNVALGFGALSPGAA